MKDENVRMVKYVAAKLHDLYLQLPFHNNGCSMHGSQNKVHFWQ